MLGDEKALSIGEKANHDVEGRMHWLLKLSCHEEAGHSECNQAGCFLSFDSQVHQVSVCDADSEEERVDLVAFMPVQVFNQNHHALSLSSSDRKSLTVSGDICSDSIFLVEHSLVSGLREFWGELALDVVVVTCSCW